MSPSPTDEARPRDEASVRRWARYYTSRGRAVVPLRPKSKKLLERDLPTGIFTNREIEQYFDRSTNIGLRLGGLTDVDLDAPEAVLLAPSFLPRTGMRHGRRGNPVSHWWYSADPAPQTESFRDVDGTML